MRCLPGLFLLSVGLLNAAGLRSVAEERQCSAEFESLRFVATPQGPRVPLYWDQKLINYLTQSYGETRQRGSAAAGPLVLPVYSAEALIFRSGSYVFVTTGLLARIHDETELLQVFDQPARFVAGRREGASIRGCGVLTPETTAFGAVWSQMKESLSRYEAGTHLKLKRRPGAAQPAPAESTELER